MSSSQNPSSSSPPPPDTAEAAPWLGAVPGARPGVSKVWRMLTWRSEGSGEEPSSRCKGRAQTEIVQEGMDSFSDETLWGDSRRKEAGADQTGSRCRKEARVSTTKSQTQNACSDLGYPAIEIFLLLVALGGQKHPPANPPHLVVFETRRSILSRFASNGDFTLKNPTSRHLLTKD